MRYYDLRIWEDQPRPSDKAFADATRSRLHKAAEKLAKGENNSFAKKIASDPDQSNDFLIDSGSNLHFSSYLRRDHDTKTYVPGGKPRTDTFDPGALDISFEIEETDYTKFGKPHLGSQITIKGIDPYTIGAASQLTGKTVELKAGMGHGLPLAKTR